MKVVATSICVHIYTRAYICVHIYTYIRVYIYTCVNELRHGSYYFQKHVITFEKTRSHTCLFIECLLLKLD